MDRPPLAAGSESREDALPYPRRWEPIGVEAAGCSTYTASLAGRKATGAAKARSHEQAQHAAQIRWARAREKAAQKTVSWNKN